MNRGCSGGIIVTPYYQKMFPAVFLVFLALIGAPACLHDIIERLSLFLHTLLPSTKITNKSSFYFSFFIIVSFKLMSEALNPAHGETTQGPEEQRNDEWQRLHGNLTSTRSTGQQHWTSRPHLSFLSLPQRCIYLQLHVAKGKMLFVWVK